MIRSKIEVIEFGVGVEGRVWRVENDFTREKKSLSDGFFKGACLPSGVIESKEKVVNLNKGRRQYLGGWCSVISTLFIKEQIDENLVINDQVKAEIDNS